MQTAIDDIVTHAQSIATGKHESVHPGQDFVFSSAAQAGDCVWQGDLCLGLIDAIPPGYQRVSRPTAVDKQLVPGNTTGARHCLQTLCGVQIYREPEWGEDSLRGPVVVCRSTGIVTHPTHGAVTIPAGSMVQCLYQREFDAEQRRERRSRD